MKSSSDRMGIPSCWAFLFLPDVDVTSLLIRYDVDPLTADATLPPCDSM